MVKENGILGLVFNINISISDCYRQSHDALSSCISVMTHSDFSTSQNEIFCAILLNTRISRGEKFVLF